MFNLTGIEPKITYVDQYGNGIVLTSKVIAENHLKQYEQLTLTKEEARNLYLYLRYFFGEYGDIPIEDVEW